MRKAVVLLMTLIMLGMWTQLSLASTGTRHIDTSHVFTGKEEVQKQELEMVEKAKEEKEPLIKEKTTVTNKLQEDGQEEVKEKGAHEEESKEEEASWKIPGWQSIFTALAVLFYGLMVTFLPKIMAKEEGHH